MAYSKLVQTFLDAWGSVSGFFAQNQFENVDWSTFQNFSKANADLHDRGPNAQRGLLKRFRYVTQAEVAANGNEGDALENLDFDTCCVGTQIVVQYYQPDPLVAAIRDQVLVAAYDPSPDAKFVYSDGSFRAGDRIAPAKFVPVASAQGQYGYVRRDTVPASIKDWREGELSIWELNGVDEFATAKQAGGPWPAFTGVDDAYWKPAAPPAVVDAYTKAQTDALLATKQGAILKQVYQGWPFNSTTLNLTSTSFNRYLRLDAQANSTLNLPTPTAADVGKLIALWHHGRSANLTVLVQAKYTNGVKPLDADPTAVVSILPYDYVAELMVVSIDRGTPYNDTVPGYAVVALSTLEPTAGYTDAQARAAQLGRVAPAGTTAIYFDGSERPRDYGTATSGTTFTIDATNAVQDAHASFRLAAGATQPNFINAPAGKPFDYVGDTYASGKAFIYSVFVLADAIQVVIKAR